MTAAKSSSLSEVQDSEQVYIQSLGFAAAVQRGRV
jgi:hypothetical protein